jgi:CRP-like cAMP-binding protein
MLLARIGGEPLPDMHRLAGSITTTTYDAGRAVFRPGDRETRIFIVASGLIKLVYTQPDGTEWIKSFIPEGKFFACSTALRAGGVAGFSAEVMEKAVIEHFPFAAILGLALDQLAWSNVLNAMLLDYAIRKEERERAFLTLKPADRYNWLEDAMPDLVSRVPQKDLAAFLGVTPVGLNRIIKRRERKGSAINEPV